METTDVLYPDAADASVRSARAADLEAIGAVQARAWRAAYAGVLPADVLGALEPAGFAQAWQGAVASPPSRRHRVLVACTGSTIVGLCASAPDDEGAASGAAGGPSSPYAELVTLVVDPAHHRLGHASRMLAATVDHLRSDGVTVLRTWVPAADGPRREFLASAGFGPDGSARELELPGGGTLREVRLVAALA